MWRFILKDKVKQVIADVLMLDLIDIEDGSSPDNIEKWDSLKQMDIILSIEEEFDIRLIDEDVVEMLNVELICNIVESYLED